MTESNDPKPPLSRMRFSWQRGAPPREGDAAPPPAVHDLDPAAPPEEPSAGEQGVQDATAYDHQAPPSDTPAPPQQPPQQAGQPATRLGRASDPSPSPSAGRGDASGALQQPTRNSASDSILTERFNLDDDSRRFSLRARQAARSSADSGSAGSAGATGVAGATTSGRNETGTENADADGDGTGRRNRRSNRRNHDKRDKQDKRGKGGQGRTSGSRGSFEVPKPGGRFSGGRGHHVAIRVLLLTTACLLVLGITGYSAYTFGIASARDDDYALSQQDIQRFGLTEFPQEQAGRFAADYARLCMTHSTEGNGEERRQEQLARYVSSGVDSSCGWSGSADQDVTDASWTGDSEPIDIDGLDGHARMMTVRVLTADERSKMVTVPVYVEDLRSGQGMRVVGDIGEMPQTLLTAPPSVEPVGSVDQELTDRLTQEQFFQQFFEAWGASEEPSVNRFVTPNATDRARAGLSGTLERPRISDAEVFLPPNADDEHSWSQGDSTEAYVWVTWRNPSHGSDVTVTRAYRIQLVMTEEAPNAAQGWAVRDVRGGVPNVDTE